MDISKIEQIVSSIIAAAPAIEAGLATAEPYVEAIVSMIQNGGAPSDEEWAALKARLDAGSAALQAAANEPDPAA
jgi:hypothetical protein